MRRLLLDHEPVLVPVWAKDAAGGALLVGLLRVGRALLELLELFIVLLLHLYLLLNLVLSSLGAGLVLIDIHLLFIHHFYFLLLLIHHLVLLVDHRLGLLRRVWEALVAHLLVDQQLLLELLLLGYPLLQLEFGLLSEGLVSLKLLIQLLLLLLLLVALKQHISTHYLLLLIHLELVGHHLLAL